MATDGLGRPEFMDDGWWNEQHKKLAPNIQFNPLLPSSTPEDAIARCPLCWEALPSEKNYVEISPLTGRLDRVPTCKCPR